MKLLAADLPVSDQIRFLNGNIGNELTRQKEMVIFELRSIYSTGVIHNVSNPWVFPLSNRTPLSVG